MKMVKSARKKTILLGLVLLVCLPGRSAHAQEKKTFVAFSMKVAQSQVEEALRKGEDFRTKRPDLFFLGYITKPLAVVLDSASGDWILLGERDPRSSELTLDDWVVALRARFIHADRDPGVTIDPRPCAECLKAGTKEACTHQTQQDVRFFAGIEGTHFGQVCYQADWLMKRIGLGFEKLPVETLKTYYDLTVEQARNSGFAKTRVSSRFWFYPIVNRVNVLSDLVLLDKFQMGVFTEVLRAEVDGKLIADVAKFEHYPSDGFSRSFSENYDAAAQAREVLDTLRGLTQLVALAKGLTQVDQKPSLEFFLKNYPIQQVETPIEKEVLRKTSDQAGIEISGGVDLMALAMRIRGGDAAALRAMVLAARRVVGPTGLSWVFETELRDGQLAAVRVPSGEGIPSQVVPLYQQGAFLLAKRRYLAAAECYTTVLHISPKSWEALACRANAYQLAHQYVPALADIDQAIVLKPDYPELYIIRAIVYMDGKQLADAAIADLTKAISLNPNLAPLYYNRGLVHTIKADYDRSVADYDKAIQLDPNDASSYHNRGIAYHRKGIPDRALADLCKAISLGPDDPLSYRSRAIVYADRGDYEHALADYDRAIALDPSDAVSHNNRGQIYLNQGLVDRAIYDYDRAIAISPNDGRLYANRARAYIEGQLSPERAVPDLDKAIQLEPSAGHYSDRGNAYCLMQYYEHALEDFNKAIELNPKASAPYTGRGLVYEAKGNHGQALDEYSKAIEINPKDCTAYNNRGGVYAAQGDYDRAIQEYAKAIEIDSSFSVSYRNQALAYEHLKRFDDALLSWRKFVELAEPKDARLVDRAKNRIEELKESKK